MEHLLEQCNWQQLTLVLSLEDEAFVAAGMRGGWERKAAAKFEGGGEMETGVGGKGV